MTCRTRIPQDVYNNLQDLFQRNNVRPQNNNANPMLGQNSPLYKREKSNTQPTTQGTTSGIGGGSSRSGARWRLLSVGTQDQQQLG